MLHTLEQVFPSCLCLLLIHSTQNSFQLMICKIFAGCEMPCKCGLQARTCLQLKSCLGGGGAAALMQDLFSAYLLHRLDNKSRGGTPGGHRGGFRGRGRSRGGKGSSASGRDAYSGQSSDRCCHRSHTLLHDSCSQRAHTNIFDANAETSMNSIAQANSSTHGGWPSDQASQYILRHSVPVTAIL